MHDSRTKPSTRRLTSLSSFINTSGFRATGWSLRTLLPLFTARVTAIVMPTVGYRDAGLWIYLLTISSREMIVQ